MKMLMATFSSILNRGTSPLLLWSRRQVIHRTSVASFSTKDSNARIPSIVLYQYSICPFCNIVKAVLSYSGLDYEMIEVNPLTKAEIGWSKDYKKVPIATINGAQLNGSDAIVQELLEHPAVASKQLINSTDDETQKWVNFARDDLSSLLYPNICRTWNDSYLAFAYVDKVDSFTPFQKVVIQNLGSLAMYFAASKIKKKRNITDERKALNEVLTRLEDEGLGKGKKFLSGTDMPNLADVAVYGTIRSIEGLPAHTEMLDGRDASSPLPEWYQRMKMQVEK